MFKDNTTIVFKVLVVTSCQSVQIVLIVFSCVLIYAVLTVAQKVHERLDMVAQLALSFFSP